MIRHIVTWKLKATDEAGKADAFAAISAALAPLPAIIPEVQNLLVARNSAYADVNWDVVLTAEYDSVEALGAYQVHPDHQAAASIVREHVAERASIDFEV
jgi:hypothetical protein